MNSNPPSQSSPTPSQPPLAPPLCERPRSARSHRCRNGKVARLPKDLRDQINSLLLDGLTYAAIIERLGPAAKDLHPQNLSNWRLGGFKDWLRQQNRLHSLHARHEFAASLAASDTDSARLNAATLHLAAIQLCEILLDLKPAALRPILAKDPDKFTRLLNAIARITDGHLKRERHRAAHPLPQPAVLPGLSPETIEKIERELRLF